MRLSGGKGCRLGEHVLQIGHAALRLALANINRGDVSSLVVFALDAEHERLRHAIGVLAPALEQVEHLRKRSLATAAGDIADIVRLFARRVVGDVLTISPDALRRLVEDAIDQLPEGEEVTILVPPSAVELLGPHLAGRVVADPDIQGGALLKTRTTSLDATLETALAGLDAALRDWLSEP